MYTGFMTYKMWRFSIKETIMAENKSEEKVYNIGVEATMDVIGGK